MTRGPTQGGGAIRPGFLSSPRTMQMIDAAPSMAHTTQPSSHVQCSLGLRSSKRNDVADDHEAEEAERGPRVGREVLNFVMKKLGRLHRREAAAQRPPVFDGVPRRLGARTGKWTRRMSSSCLYHVPTPDGLRSEDRGKFLEWSTQSATNAFHGSAHL